MAIRKCCETTKQKWHKREKEKPLYLRIHELQNPDVESQEKLSVFCVLAERVVQSAATVWENT